LPAVAGQMLGFFAGIDCQFPQFPYVAHLRGWSAEDIENNECDARESASLHEGAGDHFTAGNGELSPGVILSRP
jgi:hypothetical protein